MNIRKILEDCYQINSIKIKKINYGVINNNFLVLSGNKKFLLKEYLLDKEEKIKFEIKIYEKLEKNNFPSPKPIKNIKNNFISQKNIILFEYIEGEIIKGINRKSVEKIGKLTGQMHRILKNVKQDIKIKIWEFVDMKEIIFKEAQEVKKRKFKNPENFIKLIQEEFKRIDFPRNLSKGITHQDIKPENIIKGKNNKISFIDFNNCYYGILLFDIMTFPIWALFDKKNNFNLQLFKIYLKSYEKERQMSKQEKKYIKEALKFRLLREAYVWPYRWIDEKKAKRYAWMFWNRYENILDFNF